MKTYYQKVKCNVRLPKEDGIYLTDVGTIQFNLIPNEWTFKDNYGETQQIKPDYWMEEQIFQPLSNIRP